MLMETYTGRLINLRDPDPADICIEDIAHHLANICRYNGAVDRHLSVAQHSVWVFVEAYHRDRNDHILQAMALLHDAHEAYIGDMHRPLCEAYPELKPIREEAIARLDAAICKALGVPNEFHRVKDFDNAVLLAEAQYRMTSKGEGWGQYIKVEPAKTVDASQVWTPAKAKDEFLDWWHSLKPLITKAA